MQGIDTNVLVRYLVQDDPVQYQQALTLLKGLPMIYLSAIVIVETVWVLSRFYQVSREKQCEQLRKLLHIHRFVTEDRQATLRAIDDYSKGYDFADAMIGHHNANKCSTTWTFDRKASRLAEFTRMPANH